MKSFIYFIQTTAYIKIGLAKDPIKRLASFQIASPKKLHLVGLIEGRSWTEAKLHRQFADIRVRGEWFRATPELRQWIDEHAKGAIFQEITSCA
jgi:hypothetical protein